MMEAGSHGDYHSPWHKMKENYRAGTLGQYSIAPYESVAGYHTK